MLRFVRLVSILLLAMATFITCENVSDAPQILSGTNASPSTETSSETTQAVTGAKKQHGVGDVVRARGTKKTAEISGLSLKQADWNDVQPLTFRALTKDYRTYRKSKTFPEGGISGHHGAAVRISGAIMPIDSPGPDGEMQRFWLANPKVVMAGCVFCNPPTLADLIYVETGEIPFKVDREELYRSVIVLKLTGRFFIESMQTDDGVEYLFRLNLKEVSE